MKRFYQSSTKAHLFVKEKLDTLIEKEMQNLETSQKIALKSAKEIEEFQHEICILNK